ncbi:MAG: methionine--tRNA ligase, partial [Bowdeniella nasicola]|nr:methionine--tRNA ligase [Bowdeniella nasicola]
LIDKIAAGFDTVGDLIHDHHQKAALAEVMHLVAEANKYVTDTQPFKLKAPEQRERLATVLHTLIQAVSNLNVMMSPFLPHAANKIDKIVGGDGKLAPLPRIEEVTDLDSGHPYPIITGDYTNTPAWEPRPVTVGAPISKPKGVFVKLDDAVIDEELGRVEQQ